MATVNDCLIQLQKLTRQNLDILQAINDSFITNQSHLSVKIDDTKFAIPSFISLENKINNLQDNFNNLINAPKTGEAYFNFDGNSRVIEVRGYTHTPESIELNAPEIFGVETNNIFKDFTTPTPYINFKLPESISDDITTVNIKKIIPINTELKEFLSGLIEENSPSTQYKYSELYKKLYVYKKDTDYIEYDTLKKLPLRKNIGSGIYVIESIISDTIDENLDEYITLKIRNNIDNSLNDSYLNKFYYKQSDETLEFPLHVGDQLVTFDDSAKVEITELRQNANTMVIKVLNGEYLNLTAESEETDPNSITSLAKLKYFSSQYNDNKYIKVPLEEDDLIYITISVVNDRMNIQSPWGTGVVINTTKLLDVDGNKYKEYYKANVSNVGDVLAELVKMLPGELTKLSEGDFNNLKNEKPVIDLNNLQVVQINKHLNDSTTVKNIRSLYSQKLKYQQDLNDVQEKITDINTQLSSISFENTDNLKEVYTQQLSELTKNKNSILTSITKIIDEISLAANSSDVPIENAKYHIRGFYDIKDKHIKGIKVYYRYKNLDNTTGNASTIGENFLFSDWNVMDNFLNTKEVYYDNGYNFKEKDDNSTKNEPSFNQIDIPISQGETVDIKLQFIYDYCYPYAELTSDWSDVVNIEFPKEFLKDIQILDIISENNNDIETNRFKNILTENGVLEHVADKVVDQDITYFHGPDKIASGFYTTERRVIPLKDKLTELMNKLTVLEDEIVGSSSNAIDVSLSVGENNYNILPLQENNIFLKGFNEFSGNSSVVNGYNWNNTNSVVTATANITLTNNSSHSVKLYPLFTGSSDSPINDNQNNTKNLSNYVLGNISTVEDLKEKLADIEKDLKNNWEAHTNIINKINVLQNYINNLNNKFSVSDDNYYLPIISNLDKINEIKIEKFDKYFTLTIPYLFTTDRSYIPYKNDNTIYTEYDDKKNELKNFEISGEFVFYIKNYILDKLGNTYNISLNDLYTDSKNVLDGIIIKPTTVSKDKIDYDQFTDGVESLCFELVKPDENDVLLNVSVYEESTITAINSINIPLKITTEDSWTIPSNSGKSVNCHLAGVMIFDSNIDGKKTYKNNNNIQFIYPAPPQQSITTNRIIALSADTNTEGESDTNIGGETNNNTPQQTTNDANSVFNENGDIQTKYVINSVTDKYGVWMLGYKDNELKAFIQTNNQLMYFRTYKINSYKTIYTNDLDTDKTPVEYNKQNIFTVNNKLSGTIYGMNLPNKSSGTDPGIPGVSVYPYLNNVHHLICNNIGYVSYYLLNPGESISVPVLIRYRLNDSVNDVKKTLSFDIKTSLYNDPVNYEFTINCKTQLSDIERSLMENKADQLPTKYTSTVTK